MCAYSHMDEELMVSGSSPSDAITWAVVLFQSWNADSILHSWMLVIPLHFSRTFFDRRLCIIYSRIVPYYREWKHCKSWEYFNQLSALAMGSCHWQWSVASRSYPHCLGSYSTSAWWQNPGLYSLIPNPVLLFYGLKGKILRTFLCWNQAPTPLDVMPLAVSQSIV